MKLTKENINEWLAKLDDLSEKYYVKNISKTQTHDDWLNSCEGIDYEIYLWEEMTS